jgi:hypothetical protein
MKVEPREAGPRLMLHITCYFEGGFLVGYPEFDSTGVEHVGPILIRKTDPWWSDMPDHQGQTRSWRTAFVFENDARWNDFVILAALTQCSDMFDDIRPNLPSEMPYFYAAYENGEPLFAMDSDGLVIDDRKQAYFSKFPLPFGSYSFDRAITSYI